MGAHCLTFDHCPSPPRRGRNSGAPAWQGPQTYRGAGIGVRRSEAVTLCTAWHAARQPFQPQPPSSLPPHLAGVIVVSESVDDRGGGELGQVHHVLVTKQTRHDHVVVPAPRAWTTGDDGFQAQGMRSARVATHAACRAEPRPSPAAHPCASRAWHLPSPPFPPSPNPTLTHLLSTRAMSCVGSRFPSSMVSGPR